MINPDDVKEDVQEWAKKIGVRPVQIHLRPMKRKWASCSSKGRITINTDILTRNKAFLHEVIVHELLHLKYPNHGKMFKVLMRTYLGK